MENNSKNPAKKEDAHACMADSKEQDKKVDRSKDQSGKKSTSSSTKPQTGGTESSERSNAE